MDCYALFKRQGPTLDEAPNSRGLRTVLLKHCSYSINTTHAVEKSTEPSEVLK